MNENSTGNEPEPDDGMRPKDDDRRGERAEHEPRWRRWAMGVGIGIGLAAAAVAAYLMLGRSGGSPTPPEPAEPSPAGDLREIVEQRAVEVPRHFRELPEGWKPSAAKIEEARRLGLDMPPGKTLVDPYRRMVAR